MAKRGMSTMSASRTRTPHGGGGAASAVLQQENTMLKDTVSGLEKERDFYFNKLRDIELLIQQAVEEQPELETEDGVMKQIQSILYSTEVILHSHANFWTTLTQYWFKGRIRDTC